MLLFGIACKIFLITNLVCSFGYAFKDTHTKVSPERSAESRLNRNIARDQKPNCGIPDEKYPPKSGLVSGRILNGYLANPHSFPWIVEISRGDSHICGGSIIRCPNSEQAKIIVSASHCFHNYDNSDITVRLGKNDLRKREQGEHVSKADVFVHENFNLTVFFNDIAIVRLKNPANFSDTIRPICLPNENQYFKHGTPVIVAGWGSTAEMSPSSKTLRQVDVKVINTRLCNDTFKVFRGELDYDKMTCAGYKGGFYDSCQGDSGGPLIVNSMDFSNAEHSYYVLVGAVSFGEGCGIAEQPGVYARISNYLKWIGEKVEKLC